MKHRSITTKLFSIIGMFAVAFVVLGGFCYQSLHGIVVDGEVYEAITRNKDLIADILPPPAFIIESYATAMDILESRDRAAIAALTEKLQGLRQEYQDRQAFWRQSPISPRAQSLLTAASADPATRFYDAAFGSFLPAVAAGDQDTARDVFFGTLRPLYLAHRAVIENLAKVAGEEVTAIETGARDRIRATLVGLGLFSLAVFAGAIAFALFVSRQITRPMRRLLEYSKRTSEGNFEEAPAIEQRDEIGILARHVSAMVHNLARLVEESRATGERARHEAANAHQCKLEAECAKDDMQKRQESLLATADSLVAVAEALEQAMEAIAHQVDASNDGARAQSHQLEETATAMDQMAGTVLEVAKNAGDASLAAARARDKAVTGAGAVAEVVRGIDAVSTLADSLKEDMGHLGRRADGIGRIIGVITDIADQTNLLALNAAIEAARAGDAGRGFAVVADEVRKLAEKTMTATREVGQAVTGIQEETHKTVDSVDRAVSGIAQTTATARRSGAALGEIVSLVDAVAGQVQSIAAASEEQSAAGEEINRAIDGINRISSDTAQAMAASVTALERLRGQSEVLSGLIEAMRRQGGQALPDLAAMEPVAP
ncbi:MAG: methyl-accepting chemotaxis protein [Solidesulfovibrio sp.]|uniref:HAMP domain-containing methyl-accepting chemotaxis protein n=1 Tax=Solidesulfovibrio sp. TaxID=2910990 RepID=UPI0031584590